jgi:hypothetical protein
MPSEQEELKLIVTLVDNASPGLDKIIEKSKELGGPQVKEAHEKMRRETESLNKAFKEIAGGFGEAFKALGEFRGGLISGVGGLAIFGIEMTKQIGELKKWAEEMRGISQAAKAIGVDPASMKNIIAQFEAVGVSAEQTKANLEKMAGAVADLSRVDSPLRRSLMHMAGADPESRRAMDQFLTRFARAKTEQERYNIVSEAGEKVRQHAIEQEIARGATRDQARIEATKRQTDFESSFWDKSMLAKKRLAEMDAADRQTLNERIAKGNEFADITGDIASEWSDIVDELKAPFLDPAIAAANKLLGIFKQIHEETARANKIDKEHPAPEGFLQKLNPWNQQNIEREQRMRHPENYDESGQKKTTEDNTKATKDLDDSTKALIDALKQGYNPISYKGAGFDRGMVQNAAYTTGGGGAYGAGADRGYGAFGGGRGGGGGGGGGGPYGSHVGPGTGAGAGDTPAVGGGNATGNRSDMSVPAAIRYNNPGAQWPSAESKQFGMTDVGVIGGGNKIAGFPTAVHGLASNMALLARKYVGMTVGSAIGKWSGGGRGSVPGFRGDQVITEEMAKDPKFMLPFFQQMQKAEAGKEFMTPEQLQQGFDMYMSGSAKAYAEQNPGKTILGAGSSSNTAGPGTGKGAGDTPVGGGGYGGKYTPGADLSNVNQRLVEAIKGGASYLPEGYTVKPTSGFRGGTMQSYHGKHEAVDVEIYDPHGRRITNRGDDPEAVAIYGRYAQGVKTWTSKNDPKLGPQLGWGGAFGTQLGGGGVPDLMHFDLGGSRGRMRPERQIGKLPLLPDAPATTAADRFKDWPDRQLEGARKDIDKSQSSVGKVEATGKLRVDVNGPKGTKVDAQGTGPFKDVEINRQTQMEPAKKGPETLSI